jgi:TnpA family transposase
MLIGYARVSTNEQDTTAQSSALKLVRTQWEKILRLGASIRHGTVTASLIIRRLASYPRQNSLHTALREVGRIERSLFHVGVDERS